MTPAGGSSSRPAGIHPPQPSFVVSIKIEMRTRTPMACGKGKRKASYDCVIGERPQVSGMDPPCGDAATPAASSESISAVPAWRNTAPARPGGSACSRINGSAVLSPSCTATAAIAGLSANSPPGSPCLARRSPFALRRWWASRCPNICGGGACSLPSGRDVENRPRSPAWRRRLATLRKARSGMPISERLGDHLGDIEPSTKLRSPRPLSRSVQIGRRGVDRRN
jgi:hypothetical protein